MSVYPFGAPATGERGGGRLSRLMPPGTSAGKRAKFDLETGAEKKGKESGNY